MVYLNNIGNIHQISRITEISAQTIDLTLAKHVLLTWVIIKLRPRLVQLHKDQLGQVLVLGAGLLIRMNSQTSFPVHLLDIARRHKLVHATLSPSRPWEDHLVEGAQ